MSEATFNLGIHQKGLIKDFLEHHYVLLSLLVTRVIVTILAFMGLYYIGVNVRFGTEEEFYTFFDNALLYILPEVFWSFLFPYILWGRPIQKLLNKFLDGKEISNDELEKIGPLALKYPFRQVCFDFVTGVVLCLSPMAVHLHMMGIKFSTLVHTYIGGLLAIFLDVSYAYLILTSFLRRVLNFFYDRGFRSGREHEGKRLFSRFFYPYLITTLTLVLILATLAYRQNVGIGFELADVKNKILVIFVFTIFFMATLSYLHAHSVASPVALMKEAMKRVGKGDFSVRVPDVSGDEVAHLARTINEMVSWLEDLTANLERKVEQRTEELKNAYEKLKETQDELVKSEKMSSVGILAAGMAHELNNPVGAIRAYLQGTIENLPADSPLKERLQGAVRATDRCKRIVADLLTFSRDDKSAKMSDVNEVVKKTVDIASKESTDQNLSFAVDLDEKMPQIMIDPMQIQQVLMNLINNSKDAIKGEGKIVVKTSVENDFVKMEVRDNGCGMSQDVVSKVFDPFFTTKSPGKGMGLGLSISYSLITRYNGTIDVKSKVGEGTVFTISLPMMKEVNDVKQSS